MEARRSSSSAITSDSAHRAPTSQSPSLPVFHRYALSFLLRRWLKVRLACGHSCRRSVFCRIRPLRSYSITIIWGMSITYLA